MLRIGFVAGAFDLLHAGHVLMLKDARSQCDYLIAGLHIDPSIERPQKNKPIQTLEERRIQLEGCKYVDEIIEYETEQDLIDILKTEGISIRILGSDYTHNFTGNTMGIPVYYHQRKHNFSSTELRNRINNTVNA